MSNWNLVLIQKTSSELIMACHQKHKKKTNLYKLKKNTFSKTAVLFFKILFKNCKKQVHKGYTLAGPCICNYELELVFAIRNTLSGSPVFLFLSSFLIVVEWMVLNCDWMLFKSIDQANLFNLKKNAFSKTAVFNQNPMGIPSEPIRKERICQNFIRSLRGESRFLVYHCESDHPS